jgi:RNA polymerase sigma-70 factor (ECF subfamily)
MQNKNDLSDEELMVLYQGGDFAAFEILYRRHSGRIFEYLKKKVDITHAQELLQDTFEKLHRSRVKYNAQYPFLPWLFTISRNALLDFYKTAETKVLQSSSSAPILLDNLVAVVADAQSPHDISAILSELPQNQRRAIELRYLHDWSFEKIASDMKISEINTRQLISRGIKRLRSALIGRGW